jgi:hypothetical protein
MVDSSTATLREEKDEEVQLNIMLLANRLNSLLDLMYERKLN